ncbi:MAG: stage III sporulation protein AF [Defluviitaleaceae bacterium]|nr:stage III sporulation protein AF [Defluviitaleaceae bacterium]MCL2239030.1 stage III sporulation protein AF [Defluviitaleaceae bacterium]
MSAFFSYITNITYYLLFAGVAHRVAPAGKYRKFVTLVTGFVLVIMVIAPLRNFSADFDGLDFFAGVAGLPILQPAFAPGEPGYTALHRAHLSAAFEEQLTIQLRGMLARSDITLHEASFSYTEDFTRITGAWVSVSRAEEPRRVPFIRIEPVRVNREAAAEAHPLASEAKNLIADFYNLPHEHIHVILRYP